MPRAEAARAPSAVRPTPMLLGSSALARRLDADVRAAATARCVLLEGEPGLDPADLARTIHGLSGREGSFVVLGDAEPSDVERELFGESLRRPGGDVETIGVHSTLNRARGGTLFLGDLSDLSSSVQARLARVARDGEARVGGTGVCRLDLALVGTIGTDGDADAGDGRLRRDLLRHFARARVSIPPLRRRAEDLPAMIDALLVQASTDGSAAPKSLAQAARTLLAAMPWPGNIAELRHAVSRIAHAAESSTIQLEDVLAHVRFDGTLAPHAPAGTLRAARQQFERDYVALVLRHHRGRVGDAARSLGMQRTNLYRKARQLGISVARQGHNNEYS